MAIDFTAAELAQRQREMTHTTSTSSEQLMEEDAARRRAAAELPGQVAQGFTAGVLGAPVDIANVFARALGLNIEKPVLGSEWIGEKLKARTSSTGFQIGTAVPMGPDDFAKGAVGLLGMAKSAGKLEDALKTADTMGDALRSTTVQSFSDDPARWADKTLKWAEESKRAVKVGEHKRGNIYLEVFDKKTQPYGIGQATLADPSGKVLGTAFYDRRADGALEAAVEVAPDARRQGIATALYDAIEAAAKEKLAPSLSHTQAAELFWRARKEKQPKFNLTTSRALSPADRLAIAEELRTQRAAERASRSDPMR